MTEHMTTDPAARAPAAIGRGARPSRRRSPNSAGSGRTASSRPLAAAVRANATFSAVSGLVLLVGAPALGGAIGAPAWLLATVGVGLLAFAIVLVWLLTAPHRLTRGVPVVVLADAAWVLAAGALLLAFPTALAPVGRFTLGAVSLVVAALAIWQAMGLRRHVRAPR